MHISRTAVTAFLLLVSLSPLGCSPGSEAPGNADAGKRPPVDIPLPDVPAELGGSGFVAWLEETGNKTWQTGRGTASGSPDAVKGGQLRMAMTEFPSTLRMIGKDSNNFFNSGVGSLIFESLITLDSNTLEMIPRIATHWMISPDKMTYSFRIDPEARWADGQPITSDDVVATWQLLVDEGILYPSTNILYGMFDEPVAESPYIVHVTAKETNWRLFLYFGISMKILPAHILGGLEGSEYLEKYQFSMVPGSGPYEVLEENIDKGRSIILSRRKDWWGRNLDWNRGLYNFDEIKWLVVMDERLLLEKFKKGELDIYVVGRASWWVNEFNFDEIQRGIMLKAKIFNEETRGISGLAFNMREAPFDDIRVRRAFAHLYNRDKLIDKLFHDEYLKLYSYFPGGVYENPDNIRYEYDREKGVRLLKEAGWGERNTDGWLVNERGEILDLTLTFANPSWERIHTVLQEDLADVGIRLNLKQMTSATRFKNVMNHNFKIAFQSWSGLYWPNPLTSWHSDAADATPSTNVCGTKDALIDSLSTIYDEEYDQAKREELVKQMDLRLSELCPYALAWYGPFHRLVWWNKFGYPEGYLGRMGDFLSIQSLWYLDPDQKSDMEEAISDNLTLPTIPIENRYWLNRLGKE